MSKRETYKANEMMKALDARYGEYSTDKELAREIILDALTFALIEGHPNVETGLEKVARDYTPSKTRRVRRQVVQIAHDIFLKYGTTTNVDMTSHPINKFFENEL
jgi:hypothetical protein